MNTLIRFRQAPVTTKELKLNIFAPVEKKKPEMVEKYILFEDEEYYKVELTGYKLNQIHRDILDIILHFGDTKIENMILEDELAVRTFSLYQIQKHLNYKSKKNAKWIRDKFSELKNVTLKITDKKAGDDIEFSIIRVIKHSKNLGTYILVMEELYMYFFEKEISIGYKKLLPEILNLKHAQTKALVRYILTHTTGHQINIDKALRKIGIKGSKRNLEYYRNLVLKELKEKGHLFNIELIKTTDDKRKKNDILLKYTRHKDVKIYYPNQTKTEKSEKI